MKLGKAIGTLLVIGAGVGLVLVFTRRKTASAFLRPLRLIQGGSGQPLELEQPQETPASQRLTSPLLRLNAPTFKPKPIVNVALPIYDPDAGLKAMLVSMQASYSGGVQVSLEYFKMMVSQYGMGPELAIAFSKVVQGENRPPAPESISTMLASMQASYAGGNVITLAEFRQLISQYGMGPELAIAFERAVRTHKAT